MSIASEITRLQNIKTAIRNALVNKGISAASSHDMEDFAADIAAIATGVTLQSKTVTPKAAQQTVSPDSGYDGLSSVVVKGDSDLVAGNIKSGVEIFGVTGSYAPATVKLQSKSVTPSTSAQTVTPDSGYDGLTQVSVAAISTQTKSVTPGKSAQNVTPDSGKYLTKVTVAGDSDLIASNIKSGVEIFGVTGTYAPTNVPINGSLIEATCSSDITSVSTTINGTVYTAYLDTSAHKAYLTIPYTYTGTVTVNGYAGSTLAKSATVTITGVDKYTCIITTSNVLYEAGSGWTGLSSHGWQSMAQFGGTDVAVTESNSGLSFAFEQALSNQQTTATLTPKVSSGGYSKLKITTGTVTSPNTIYAYVSSTSGMTYSTYVNLTSNGTFTYDIPSNLVNSTFFIIFWCKCASTTTRQVAVIKKMEFV